jgi:hypothetical protein
VNALVSSDRLTKYHCFKAMYLFLPPKKKKKAITEEDDGRKWEHHQIH